MAFAYKNRDWILQNHTEIGQALDEIAKQITNVQNQTNTSHTGKVLPPPQIARLNVTAAQGIFDVAITDNSPVVRGIHYFAEYSATPDFQNPTVVPMGPSRNWRGTIGSQTLFWRAYSAYPTSGNSAHVYHAGAAAQPVGVMGGGAVSGPPIQPSQGSGTAVVGNVQDGGFGNQPYRGDVRPVTVKP